MLAHLYAWRLSTYRIAERTGLGRQKVTRMLRRAGVPLRPRGAGRLQPPCRADSPVPLTTPLVKDLYRGCGTGLSHIELLTGQPAMTVRGFMRRAGIPPRHPGGRTPFLRRWRQGAASAAAGAAVKSGLRRWSSPDSPQWLMAPVCMPGGCKQEVVP